MKISAVTAIFFLIAWLTGVSGLYFWKKTQKKLYGVTWMGIVCVASLCFHVLVAALINIIHIPVNVISIGIADLLCGVWFWYRIIKKGEKQKYTYEIIDGVFLVLLFGVIAWLVRQRYGLILDIHYATVDPAAHFQDAMNVVANQKVSNMFYAALNNALLIEAMGWLTKVDYYYKIFVLADVLHFALAGLGFYGLLRKWAKDRFMKVAACVGTFIYLFGFPLNSTLFGFVYLGMGITIIGYLINITDSLLEDEYSQRVSIILLSLGCLGLFESYVMFMPVVYFGMLLAILVKQQKKRMLVSKDTVKICLEIFLIPCVLGLYYTYFGVFSDGLTVGSAIANEGHIYRDLYSNFLPFLPLALFGIWQFAKMKKWTAEVCIFPLAAVFAIGLFLMGLQGRASSYYYFKMYYLLWLLVFLLLYRGIESIHVSSRGVVVGYFVTWLLVIGIFFFNVEDRIQAKNPLFDPTKKSDLLNDVYSYNWGQLHTERYSPGKMQLYHYAYGLLEQGQKVVPLAGFFEDDYWYQAVTNQRMQGFAYWNIGEEKYFENLEKDAEYVCVLYGHDFYKENQEYFESMEHVYQNDAGFIGKVNKK